MDEKDNMSPEKKSRNSSAIRLLQEIAQTQKDQSELLRRMSEDEGEPGDTGEKRAPESGRGKGTYAYLRRREFKKELKRKWWLIAGAAALTALCALLVTTLMYTTDYEASAEVYVDFASSASPDGTMDAQSLMATFGSILRSNSVLDETAGKLREAGYPALTREALLSMIASGSDKGSRVFRITVSHSDPQEAIDAANILSEAFSARVIQVMEGASPRIVEPAREAVLQDSHLLGTVLLSALIGAAAACLWIFIFFVLLGGKLEDKRWLKEQFPDVPLLGEATISSSGREIGSGELDAAASRLNRSIPARTSAKIVGVSGPTKGEESHVLALSLALSLARLGKRVLLVEGNLTDMPLEKLLGHEEGLGLSDLLSGEVSPENKLPIRHTSLHPELSYLRAGDVSLQPGDLLGSETAGRLFDRIGPYYHFILVDLPPVTEGNESTAVARHLDGIVLGACAGVSSKKDLTRAVALLKDGDAKILGIILCDRAKEKTKEIPASGETAEAAEESGEEPPSETAWTTPEDAPDDAPDGTAEDGPEDGKESGEA